MRLVDKEQIILRYVIEQRGRSFPGKAAGHVARIVLDAVAISDGAHHLHVEHGSLPHALRFDVFALLLELRLPPRQLFQDAANGALLLLGRQDVVGFGVNGQAGERLAPNFAGQGIDGPQAVDLVSPHLDAKRMVLVRRMYFDHVPAHPEGAPAQVLAAFVLNLHEAAQQRLAGTLLPRFQHHQHAVIGFRRTQTINAGDRSHDHHVAPLEKRARRAHAQLVQLVVDRGFLFDVSVRSRYVCLRLIVVVVADEILDRIFGKEVAKFVEELRSQGLVVRQDQRRAAHLLDDFGHREGFAGTGHAQQHLMLLAALHAAHQFPNGFGLVAAGLVIAGQTKTLNVDHDGALSPEFCWVLKLLIIPHRNGAAQRPPNTTA